MNKVKQHYVMLDSILTNQSHNDNENLLVLNRINSDESECNETLHIQSLHNINKDIAFSPILDNSINKSNDGFGKFNISNSFDNLLNCLNNEPNDGYDKITQFVITPDINTKEENSNILHTSILAINIFLFGTKNIYYVAHAILKSLNFGGIFCTGKYSSNELHKVKKEFSGFKIFTHDKEFFEQDLVDRLAILMFGSNITDDIRRFSANTGMPIIFINSFGPQEIYKHTRDAVIFTDTKNTCMLKSVYNFISENCKNHILTSSKLISQYCPWERKNVAQTYLPKFKDVNDMSDTAFCEDELNSLLIIDNKFYCLNFDNNNLKFTKFINGELQTTVDQYKSIFPVQTLNDINLCEYPHINIIGKRGVGKSQLIVNLIKYYEEHDMINECIIFSPQDRMHHFYKNLTKNLNYQIYHEYDPIIVNAFMHKDGANKVIILDDCLTQNKLSNINSDSILAELSYNGRHYKTSTIIAMQYPIELCPEIRCNFDYIFLFREDCNSNLYKMYNMYAGMFPQFNQFRNIFDTFDDIGELMLIINRGNEYSLNCKVKKIKTFINISLTKVLTLSEDIDEISRHQQIIKKINKLIEDNKICRERQEQIEQELTKYIIELSILNQAKNNKLN